MGNNNNTQNLDITSESDKEIKTTSLVEGLKIVRNMGPKDFVLPGLKRGKVGSLVSPGGTGKSWMALQLGILVASGIDTLGITEGLAHPLKTGKVAYLTFEDDYLEVCERLDGVTRTHKITDSQVADFDDNLSIIQSFKIDIMNGDEEFVRRAAKGCRLLILDTFSNIHSSIENETADMAAVIDKLNRIAASCNTAILFLHHTSKSAALNGQGDMQQAARGASCLTDNIRYQSYVLSLTKDDCHKYTSDIDGVIDERNYKNYVQYGLSKYNHIKCPPAIWLVRSHTGALKPVQVKKLHPDQVKELKTSTKKRGAK